MKKKVYRIVEIHKEDGYYSSSHPSDPIVGDLIQRTQEDDFHFVRPKGYAGGEFEYASGDSEKIMYFYAVKLEEVNDES